MEPSDPKPSSTVFDVPPQETEAVVARESNDPDSMLTGSMDTVPPPASEPSSPEPEVHEEPEKAALLGLASRESASAIASARHSNLRRTAHLWKIMLVAFLANVLVLVAAGFWLKRHLAGEIERRMTPSSAVSPSSPDPSGNAGAASADLVRFEELRKADAASFKTQMDALLKRLDDAEEQNRKQAARLETLAASKGSVEEKKTGTNAVALAAPSPGELVPPTQSELILLKERNRLSAYADEAIATGARTPYERLWETLDDPRLTNLAHAARSEILRVQNFYLGGSRIDRFDIPVATYFPDDSALRDSQLKDGQLINLLLNKKNPWEVRMKAANLLGMRKSLEVGEALVEAVKKDDNLDVVKEATFSFEQLTNFHSRIFDAASLEQWWKEFKATPQPKPKDEAVKGKAPAPAPESGKAFTTPKQKSKGTEKKKS